MGHQQVKDAALPAGLPQQAITGVAGSFLQARPRLVPRPAQHGTFHAQPLEQTGRRQGFASRFRPQPMVYDQGDGAPLPDAGPVARQQGQAQ